MANRSQHAETINLITLVGAENAAALSRNVTPAEAAQIEALGAQARGMSDADMADKWGIHDASLAADLRGLLSS